MNKLLVISLLLLTGCGVLRPEVDPVIVETNLRPIEVLHPPLPNEVLWREVKWTVLTPDIIRELLQKLEDGGLGEKDLVFFALTSKGYENLSQNMREIIGYMEGQRNVIIYYREVLPKDLFEKAEE